VEQLNKINMRNKASFLLGYMAMSIMAESQRKTEGIEEISIPSSDKNTKTLRPGMQEFTIEGQVYEAINLKNAQRKHQNFLKNKTNKP
jgi:hypothetical protein